MRANVTGPILEASSSKAPDSVRGQTSERTCHYHSALSSTTVTYALLAEERHGKAYSRIFSKQWGLDST